MSTSRYVGAAIAALGITFFGATARGCYTSNQYEQNTLSAFRDAVFKDENLKVAKITVQTSKGPVTLEGNINRGHALDPTHPETAQILANQDMAVCWSSSLRVVEGQENRPLQDRFSSTPITEVVYRNPAFQSVSDSHGHHHTSGYTCSPDLVQPAR